MLEIERHSGDPLEDAQFERQRETEELRKLVSRKAQFQDKSDLEQAIASRRASLLDIEKKISALKARRAKELEDLTIRKRASLPYGNLLESITEDGEGLVYVCKKHPDRRIRDWQIHVFSFGTHPEIKENNPTRRRQMQESIERDKQEAREKVEKEYLRRESEKDKAFARQGFVKVA